MARREIPLSYPPFAALPVRMVTVGRADEQIAVHLAGRLGDARPPVVCLPGYLRNMVDYSEFVPLLQRALRTDWPVVLIDLRGRGRSYDRARARDYTSHGGYTLTTATSPARAAPPVLPSTWRRCILRIVRSAS